MLWKKLFTPCVPPKNSSAVAQRKTFLLREDFRLASGLSRGIFLGERRPDFFADVF
jgi:hypothetical protein